MYPHVDFEQRLLVGPNVDLIALFRSLYESVMGGDWQSFVDTLAHIWDVYSIIALILALLFFVGYVYAKIRYGQLSDIEQEALRKGEALWEARFGGAVTKNSRWSDVESHIAENNPNSWRLAIIEADILLEEVLTNAGYVGATIGDKLKSANATSFTTLQDAWEAHKVRNEIAHAGGDFILTKKVAQETVVRFERVFREFGAI